jgi:hypothetical protein
MDMKDVPVSYPTSTDGTPTDQIERITDPEQVRQALDALIRYGGKATVVDGQRRISAVASWLMATDTSIAWQLAETPGRNSLVAELIGCNAVYRFRIAVKAASGTVLVSDAPMEVVRIRRRRVRRVQAKDGERVAIPALGSAPMIATRPLLDFSYDGLAFCIDANGRLPAVGTLSRQPGADLR